MYRYFYLLICALFMAGAGCEQRQEILMVPLEDADDETGMQWVDVQADATHLAHHVDREARWLVAQSIARAKCVSDGAHRSPKAVPQRTRSKSKNNATSSANTTEDTKRIDLNTASLSQLQQLPRVGPVLAQAIVDARPYRTIHDLKRVRGVGAKTFEAMRPMLQVSSSE